jgi:hypothetical protein
MYGNTSGVEQMHEFIEYMNSSSEDRNVLVRLETGCMNSSSEDGNVLVCWKQESVSRLQ